MYLTGTDLSDAAVDDLVKHGHMAERNIRCTEITAAADRLAAALPNCAVHHHALTTTE